MAQISNEKEHQNNGTEKPINYEHEADVLDKILFHVGDMGRYQKLLCGAIMLSGVFYAFIYFMPYLITVTPAAYWCWVPELSDLNWELRKNLSAPGAATGDWDHCMTFDANWTDVLETLTLPADGTPLMPCQHGWEFDFSDIPYETVPTERGWVCDRASNVPTALSVFFAGAVFGTGGFGWAADRFGRVPVIIATNVIGGIGGVASIFTKGEWDFFVTRFLVGLPFFNILGVVYVLVLEYVGIKYRTLVANLTIAFSYPIAGVVLPWMAYFIADWRTLTLITSTPMFIALLAPWLLPESVKWLASRGHTDKAVTILRKFEVINRTKIPEDVMNEFKIFCENTKLEQTPSILELYRSRRLRWTMLSLILLLTGVLITMDGLTRLSDSFGLSFFAMISIHAAFEIVAIGLITIVLDRFGRRNFVTGSLLLSALFSLIVFFVPEGLPQAAFNIAARFFMASVYSASIQWCSEITPTPFRSLGLSITIMFAIAGAISVPFIVYSRRLWNPLPMVIFTVLTFLSAGFALTLPETRGLPLPQTRADSEKIVNESSLCRLGIDQSKWKHTTFEMVKPVMEEWLQRQKGSLTYWMSQILTGHWCFRNVMSQKNPILR